MKKGIIVVSFGTTYHETRKLCIESIEKRIEEEFRESLVMRAFTSRIVISRLKKRDNYHVDTPSEALAKMREKGIKDIYIQPLHIIEGHEYEKILREADGFLLDHRDCDIRIGKPLLSCDLDYEKVVQGMNLPLDGRTTLFMGHGSDHHADMSYERLEQTFRDKGHKDVFIGTVEGSKTIQDIIVELKKNGITKVNLKPFMLVAGDHATNDMASNEPNSWKTILEANQIEANIEIKGLGQIKAIQDIFIDHLRID